MRAVNATARWTTERIHAIRQLMLATADYVRMEASGVYSWKLVGLAFVQSYRRIKNVVEAGTAQRQAAAVYLKQLCEIGVLGEVKIGRGKQVRKNLAA